MYSLPSASHSLEPLPLVKQMAGEVWRFVEEMPPGMKSAIAGQDLFGLGEGHCFVNREP